MGAFSLLNVATYCGGYDFTTDTNNAMLSMEAAALDGTTFRGDGWNKVVGGLKKTSFELKGFWQSATSQAVDPQSFPDLGSPERVFTVSPNEAEPASPASILAAERAYMFQGLKTRYLLGGTIGDVAPFELSTQGSNGVGVVQGLLLKKTGTVSATGQMGSTLDTLGFGVSATQFVYATFHMFVPGTTITVQVQSDDNGGFSSATTIATIGPITVSGGTWMTPVPGPITDRYFRFNVSANTGTHTVAAAMGIR